jgi:hypothetical protein
MGRKKMPPPPPTLGEQALMYVEQGNSYLLGNEFPKPASRTEHDPTEGDPIAIANGKSEPTRGVATLVSSGLDSLTASTYVKRSRR